MNLIVAYKRITDRLIEEANLSILNFHMGARVRNQYQSNNVINIHAFQELIIVVNVWKGRNKIVYLVEAFLINLWFGFGVIASGLVLLFMFYFQSFFYLISLNSSLHSYLHAIANPINIMLEGVPVFFQNQNKFDFAFTKMKSLD